MRWIYCPQLARWQDSQYVFDEKAESWKYKPGMSGFASADYWEETQTPSIRVAFGACLRLELARKAFCRGWQRARKHDCCVQQRGT